jgi:WD40 repeat protein
MLGFLRDHARNAPQMESVRESPSFDMPGAPWMVVVNKNVLHPFNISLEHELRFTDVVSALQFSPSGIYLATDCNNGCQIFNWRTGEKISNCFHDDHHWGSIFFSPDSRYLVRVNIRAAMWITDIMTGATQAIRLGLKGRLYPHALQGKLLACAQENVVRLWDLTLGSLSSCQPRASCVKFEGTVRSLAISPDESLVAIGGYNVVELWDHRAMTVIGRLARTKVKKMAFSSTGHELLLHSSERTLEAWNISALSGAEQEATDSPAANIRSFEVLEDFTTIGWSADDKWVFSGGGTISIWAADGQPQVILRTETDQWVYCISSLIIY